MNKLKNFIEFYGKDKFYMHTIGMVLAFTTYTLCWIWFGWKLALIIFLAIVANNFERYKK